MLPPWRAPNQEPPILLLGITIAIRGHISTIQLILPPSLINRRLRAPPSVRLKGEQGRCDGSEDEERSAHIDGHARARVALRCNYRRDDAHDTVARDRDAVPRGSVGAGQHLGRVRVQAPVVDVEAKGDHAGEDDVLIVLLDGRVAEEEGAGDERSDDHGVLAPEDAPVAQEAGGNGAEDAARVSEGVVAPRLILRPVENSATGLEVLTAGRLAEHNHR